MNLTDYPTPICDANHYGNGKFPVILAQQLEREAAAWRAVAENAISKLEQAMKDEGRPMSMRACSTTRLLWEAREALDALKSQLTKP